MLTKNDKIVLASIVGGVFLFLLITRIAISGYHFVDDHEIIKIRSELSTSSLSVVTVKWVKEDLSSNTRFRPVYYIFRVFETKLFGSDFLLWSIFNGVLCCLALVFSYLSMRKLKFSIQESILFVIITYVGPQSSVWWRLGPVESLGMVFLSLSFFFMIKSQSRKNCMDNLLFILFLTLASLTKESFIIIIPALLFFKICWEKESVWSSLKESMLRNMLLIIPLLIMFTELCIIKFYVGTGYSGLDSDLGEIIPSILATIFRFFKTYLNLLAAVIILMIFCIFFRKRPAIFNTLALTFFIMIIIPNVILYSKTGLMERYLLPVTFGLAFLVITIINGIDKKEILLKKIAFVLILVSFLPYMVNSINEALSFSKEGLATKKLLSAVSANNNNSEGTLLIADPVDSYEISVSLKTYLFYEDKINLFGYELLRNEKSESEKPYIAGWKSYFEGRLYANMSSEPELLVFLDNQLVEPFFSTSAIRRNNYLPVDIGDYKFALFKKIE